MQKSKVATVYLSVLKRMIKGLMAFVIAEGINHYPNVLYIVELKHLKPGNQTLKMHTVLDVHANPSHLQMSILLKKDLINDVPHITIESIQQQVIHISAGSIETILHNVISIRKSALNEFLMCLQMRTNKNELRFLSNFRSIFSKYCYRG